jgi:Protein of unknown function (DUF2442)
MNDILRITLAEPVVQGVLKLVWNDGYEGVVDLRGIIASGDIFRHIRNPDNFKMVRVAPYGHSIYWGREEDEEVDFGSDRLRELAEEQAALLAHAG